MLDPASDFESFARLLLDAARNGDGVLLIALALVGVTALVRYFLGARVAFFKSDIGGALLAFGIGFFGAVATSLAAGDALSGELFLNALKVTFVAMGGYAGLKKLLGPVLVQGLDAAGVQVPPAMLEKAKAAGAAAVLESPPTGAAGIVGNAREVP